MAHDYMVSTVDHFFQQLDTMEKDLTQFSENVEDRRQQIVHAIMDFQKETERLKRQTACHGQAANLVEKAMEQSVEKTGKVLLSWNTKMLQDAKGAKFMKKHQKYLVVMVFGAVKTGKSSLGNFIAGKKFIDAPFDNAYKHHALPVYETEESGRDYGGIVEDEKGEKQFAVGYTDTTGAVQYFTLSGLRWMDSPGTGAVGQETDSKNMDELVDGYIPYTDFCLFLQNSSEPGLQADLKYIRKLTQEGQEAIVLVTRSDKTDYDVDDEGNLVRKVLPKDKDTRNLQEESIRRQLFETYPDVDNHRYSILSVSTKLAEDAILTNDDERFKNSQLDVLMNKLGDKFATEAGKLKKERVQNTVDVFIRNLLSGEETKTGIFQLMDSLSAITKECDNYAQTLNERKARMTHTIQGHIRHDARKQAEKWDDEVNRTGKPIEAQAAEMAISTMVQQYLSEAVNEEIGQVIDHFEGQSMGRFQANLDAGGIRKNTTTVPHTHKEREVHVRDPEGIVENIRGFFGKTYYDVSYKEVTTLIPVDLGSNVEEYLDMLLPALDSAVAAYVSHALDMVGQEYFAPQRRYVEEMQKALGNLQRKLRAAAFTQI